jgi:DNA-binding MarR family transcriptional regulator
MHGNQEEIGPMAAIKAKTVGGSPCSCTALRKGTRRVSQLYDAVLAPSGLKITQRAILAQINRSEPTTVSALAEILVMDAGALTHTLKPLDRDDFIAVAVDPNDRRSRLISLTRQGRAKLAETDALWAQAQAGFDAAIGRMDSDELRRMLRMLVSETFNANFQEGVAAARIGSGDRLEPGGGMGQAENDRSG